MQYGQMFVDIATTEVFLVAFDPAVLRRGS